MPPGARRRDLDQTCIMQIPCRLECPRRGWSLPALVALVALVLGVAPAARGQDDSPPSTIGTESRASSPPASARARTSTRATAAAPKGVPGTRLVIDIEGRTLAAIRGGDTIFYAPVGVATGMTLSYAGRSWRFTTPRGGRRILRKLADPVWTPPDWHYAEVAREHGLKLAHLPAGGTRLKDGRRLTVKNGLMGLVLPKRGFVPLPLDEHVVFGDRLYVPPLGTKNRRITRELGEYALDLGGGYLIHGTPEEATVGQASTHGCLRMRGFDLEWLYDNVPVGAPVTIH